MIKNQYYLEPIIKINDFLWAYAAPPKPSKNALNEKQTFYFIRTTKLKRLEKQQHKQKSSFLVVNQRTELIWVPVPGFPGGVYS